MRIQAKACYPRETSTEEQWKKVQEELEELWEEFEVDNWQDRVSEALDLAQTLLGYRDIKFCDRECWAVHIKLNGFAGLMSSYEAIKEINRMIEFCCNENNRSLWIIEDLITSSFNLAYQIVLENSHNSRKADQKMKFFMRKHKSKLKDRRKEWLA